MRVTYKATRANPERRSSLAHSAVSGRNDRVRVQQGATAEVGAIPLQTDDEGEVALLGRCSTDNIVVILLELGRGRCAADGGDRKCEEDVFEKHRDDARGAEAGLGAKSEERSD